MLRQDHRQQLLFEQAAPGDVTAEDFQQDLLYCLFWDVFQQQRDVFQLKKTHAYTFTAGGINFSDMQSRRGDQLLGQTEEGGRCAS